MLLLTSRTCTILFLSSFETQIWKETTKYQFELDPEVLKRTVLWESRRRFGLAKVSNLLVNFSLQSTKCSRKNSIVERKILSTVLGMLYSHQSPIFRYILFAIQILEKGRIYDFQTANEYYKEMFSVQVNIFGFSSVKNGRGLIRSLIGSIGSPNLNQKKKFWGLSRHSAIFMTE